FRPPFWEFESEPRPDGNPESQQTLEYYVWCANFLLDNFTEYDATYDSVVFNKVYEQHQKVFTGDPISDLGTSSAVE
ncbi:hypothetical protein OEZ49_21300, partial [Ruegeria sp. WL0004]